MRTPVRNKKTTPTFTRYTVAGMGTSLRPRANALCCRAFRVQLLKFLTGVSIQRLANCHLHEFIGHWFTC